MAPDRFVGHTAGPGGIISTILKTGRRAGRAATVMLERFRPALVCSRGACRAPRGRWRFLSYGLFVTAGSGSACLALSILAPPTPRLVWNVSASVPVGLYSVHAAVLRRGDMVVAQLPVPARAMAAERHYLPRGVPLVKTVAAVSGDTICADAAIVSINANPVATRAVADREGRALPWWHGCTTLSPGAVFLLLPDVPTSFDGRYFGPTSAGDIIGRARLLWAR